MSYIFVINNKSHNFYYSNFYNIFIYLIICLIIVFIIYILSSNLIKKNSYVEKLIPYECGFEPYEDTRNIFNIQFYLVALLFLIFDLESLFLYPLILSLSFLTKFSFYIIIEFFLELFIGYLIIYKYILKTLLV